MMSRNINVFFFSNKLAKLTGYLPSQAPSPGSLPTEAGARQETKEGSPEPPQQPPQRGRNHRQTDPEGLWGRLTPRASGRGGGPLGELADPVSW